MSRLLFLLPAIILLMPSVLLASDDDVSVGERPQWVTATDWNPSTTVPTLGSGNESVVYLLTDYQHRPKKNVRYTKRVYRVTNDAGVQQKLKVTVDFDPSYAKLVLHDISIRRDEKTIDKCDISKMKIFQPEDDLAHDIYNEEKRVLVFLDDLRVDDIVVVEYSVIGTNPALLGQYSFRLPLQYYIPVEQASYRLLWDGETPVFHQTRNSDIQPEVTQHEDYAEYAWSIPPQPAARYEDYTPLDFDDEPYLEVSNSNSWAAVVQWGLKTYITLEDPLSVDTQKVIDQWKQKNSEPQERALQAVRFVQDKIRYVGLEMGSGSLRPAAPTTTMDCRFGDCKAKSILLCAILRGMDIEASPALVNTYRGKDIENSLPTLLAFDHVIVRATLDGKTVWIDPTKSQQGGTFFTSYIPEYYGKALVINDGVEQLETVHSPTEAIDYEHTGIIFDVDDFDGTSTMKVSTRFYGSSADSMRQSLVDTNYKTLAEDYLNYYSDTYPGIRDPEPLKITDDKEHNILVINEQYLVDDLFTLDEEEPRYATLYPFGLSGVLPSPETRIRKNPLAIDHPVRRTYKTVLNTPEDLGYRDTYEEVIDPAFKFSTRQRFKGRTSEFEYSIETLKNRVAPNKMTQYLANRDKLEDLLGDYPEVPDGRLNWFAIVISLFTIAMVGGAACWVFYVTSADETPIAESAYDSIGGWLVLIGIGIFLSMFTVPLSFLQEADAYFTRSNWTDFETGTVLAFEVIVNSALVVLTFALAGSFFLKRKIFPKLFIFVAVYSILVAVIDVALCLYLLEVPPDGDIHVELIQLVIRATIWCPYMLISKRVKGTFVH